MVALQMSFLPPSPRVRHALNSTNRWKSDRVLYYDTDSVVYTWKPGETEAALGDYLGDMSNELDEDDYIEEFISAGAKNYGYVTAKVKSCVKVKGFSLNVRRMAQLNYEVMKQNILDEILHPLPEKNGYHQPPAFCPQLRQEKDKNGNTNQIVSTRVLISESWTARHVDRFLTDTKDQNKTI